MAVPDRYEIIAVPTAEWPQARRTIELEWPLTDRAWDDFLAHVLPAGLVVVRDRQSGEWIGSASALHEPAGNPRDFPAGGQLGYMGVSEPHRGHRLGLALVTAVVNRFHRAGYDHLWLGVQGWRLPAIRTYLRAGYHPFLHPPDPDILHARWLRILAALDIAPDTVSWPRAPAPFA